MTARRRHEKPWKRVNPSGETVWVARWTDQYGKRHVAGSRKLKREAQALIDAAYDAEERRLNLNGALTVAEYAQLWLERHPRSDRTNKTNQSRLRMVQDVQLDGRLLKDWPIADLRRRQANGLLHELFEVQGRAAGGAAGVLRTLSAMCEDAINDEVALVNPFRGMRIRTTDPRIKKKARPWVVLTREQTNHLAKNSPDPIAIRILAECGLRLGELLGLHWQDLKLGPCKIEWRGESCPCPVPHFHVRRTAHDGRVALGTKRERMRGKFEDGRIVPIPVGLALKLKEQPRGIGGQMFPGPAPRSAMAEQAFYRSVWAPTLERAGVKDITPKDLRRSWVSRMRAAGIDPADLAEMAGHSIEVATSVYTMAMRQSYEKAAQVR